ncbi:MAG: serine dehydratase, partial [Rhodobacteraceae bacterium]|nr:serine dehydratase [Paracoccaceae bacterium]
LSDDADKILSHLSPERGEKCEIETIEQEERTLLRGTYLTRPAQATIETLKNLSGVLQIWQTEPVYFVPKGELLFESAQEMVDLARRHGWSLGETVLNYEAALLGFSKKGALTEMVRRLDVMRKSAASGFSVDTLQLRLLNPSAHNISLREQKKTLAIGGIHTQAASCAMAVMHTTCSQGVICAAPTGGASGTVPGVVLTLMESYHLSEKQAALLLFAAAGIGLITAIRATFSAEVAGCQVEIGVAGAMAAAAVVEFAEGTADQAANAAAIALQNTMGSVCDHVQSMCEIPCHTRNAVAASSAFTCADLVLGGYENPINLDESIDASYACGRMLPEALRCTAGGGLSKTPSALRMIPRAFKTLL